MKYEHPTIKVECPAEGHYIVTGHQPRPVLTPAGYVVPSPAVHVTPELPSDVLFSILQDRGDYPPLLTVSTEGDGEPEEVSAESINALAEQMYFTYCAAVGGKVFNGDPLPAWAEFAADPAKSVQCNAWRAAAETALLGPDEEQEEEAPAVEGAPPAPPRKKRGGRPKKTAPAGETKKEAK